MDLAFTIHQEELVIESIKALGWKVCPADISRQTGLSLSAVIFTLNRLAYESQARLTVSPAGELLYIFKEGFENSKSDKDWMRNLSLFFRRLYAPAVFCFQSFFGLTLAFSLGTWVLLMLIFDQNPSPSIWEYIFALVKNPGARPGEDAKALLDCYNFICGPPNPNDNINEKKWQCVAKLIEKTNGAIIAEQLSPYTGVGTEDNEAILDTLIRFNGYPIATDNGNLVYAFPSMSATALGPPSLEQPLEPFLKERDLVFFGMPYQRVLIIGCGLYINALWGYCLALLAPVLCALMTPLGILAWILAAFSFTVSICVLLRFPVVLIKRITLFLRNLRRETYAKAFESPSEQLELRLKEAKELAIKSNYLSETNAIFDSDKDSVEQNFNQL